MTIPLPVGPGAPYVTPPILTTAPTGISWSTIPPGRTVTDAQRAAAQLDICMRATAMADAYCNQVLRATLDTEALSGPNYKVTIQNGTGNGRVVLQRWPILQIVSVQVAPNNVFPRQWTTVPAGMYDIERPVVGLFGTAAASGAGEGGQSILVAPGFINWCNGRNGVWVKVQYVNGWPHCALTQPASPGDTTLHVDDCTGWGVTSEMLGTTGVTGVIYDQGAQEVAQATATSVVAGPGTVTLATGVTYAHAVGTLYSSLPQSIMWAVTLFGAAQALTRGATATTVQAIPGGGGSTAGAHGPVDLASEAELLLDPFRRVV